MNFGTIELEQLTINIEPNSLGCLNSTNIRIFTVFTSPLTGRTETSSNLSLDDTTRFYPVTEFVFKEVQISPSK